MHSYSAYKCKGTVGLDVLQSSGNRLHCTASHCLPDLSVNLVSFAFLCCIVQQNNGGTFQDSLLEDINGCSHVKNKKESLINHCIVVVTVEKVVSQNGKKKNHI